MNTTTYNYTENLNTKMLRTCYNWVRCNIDIVEVETIEKEVEVNRDLEYRDPKDEDVLGPLQAWLHT